MAKSSTQIRREIALTRSRIDQDIDMLQARLRDGADLRRVARDYSAMMVAGSLVMMLLVAGIFVNRRSNASRPPEDRSLRRRWRR